MVARCGRAVPDNLRGTTARMKVVLIYNPSSGGRYNLRTIKRSFKEHGLTVDYSFTIKQLSSNKLATLIDKGVTVAAIGGDGTMNAAAALMVNTPSVLLPLPGGTLNHFVRDLGIAPDIESALAKVGQAKPRTIDVGYVNDQLFLNNSGLGIYPFTLIQRKALSKTLGKWLAATVAVFDQLTSFRRHKLVIDGEVVRSPFVFVGNNHYDISDGMIPGRRSLTKGILTVIVASPARRRDLIHAGMAILRGDATASDDLSVTERKDVAIYSHRASIPVSFDGEVKRLEPPLMYRIEAKSLKVLLAK